MEIAADAVNKLLNTQPRQGTTSDVSSSGGSNESQGTTSDVSSSGGSNDETVVDQTVAAPVVKETVTKEHETREQEVVEQERHQDHHRTVVQPLKERQVDTTQHDYEEAPTQYREQNNDSTASDAQGSAEQARSGFQDETHEGETHERQTKEASEVNDTGVKHHVHETVQPVIEKETVQPSVTHKTIPVKEKIQEDSQDDGVTTREPVDIDEYDGPK